MSKHEQSGKMSRRAFTLVEVVVATALLIMALAMFLGTYVSARRSAVNADNRLEAIHIARAVMENALTNSYNSLLANFSTNLTLTGAAKQTNAVWGTCTVSYVVVTTASVKNIYLTNRWINPGTRMTSTVSLAGSICPDLHP